MMKCLCPCGSDLAEARSLGLMTMANVIAEYRTCGDCKSTRPYTYPPEIEGVHIMMFHDPQAKEPIPSLTIDYEEAPVEYDNLLDALEVGPVADVAELRREGVVLARAFVGIDGVLGWKVLAPGEP